MTSFGYRLNPRYAIKECSSCGTLYTRDCCCSKGNVEDKILVPKLPKNCVSTNVVNAPREPFVVKQDHGVNPPHIDECCCVYDEALDGIICQQCTCKSCGKGAHIGYNCPPKVSIISNLELCNQTMNNEPLQTLPSFDPTVSEIKDAFGNKQYKPKDIQELFRKLLDDLQNIHEELAEFINSPGWNRPAIYDDDVDYTIAVTPVLSTEEPDNSLTKDHFETVINSNDDYSSSDNDSLYYENIEYVEASPHDSELVSLEVENIVIPKDEEIEDNTLSEKLLNVNRLIAKIEALKENSTPSSEFLTKSPSTSPKSFLEETNAFDNSDISLSEYEAFSLYDNHIEEISSGSTTTHSDISISEYDSFIFDLSNDQFPPIDRSDFTHEEFTDELAHIISPPKYDCFYFRDFPDLVEDDHSPLLAYVVWIFLAYLTYPVIPPYLHSFEDEDTIFDPGITINRFYSFKPSLSHRCGTFKIFNTHRSHLNESLMEILFSTFFPMNQV
nr:hypothetical protein [Tanacetum cinerariifolium]